MAAAGKKLAADNDTVAAETDDALIERVARRKVIEARIGELRVLIADASADYESRKFAAQQANREMDTLAHAYGAEGASNRVARPEIIAEMKAKAEAMWEGVEAAGRAFEALNAELNDLESVQLPACQAATSVEEVVAFQTRGALLRKKIEDLEAAIALQENKVVEASSGVPDISRLITKRQSLLAEIAMGKAEEAALTRFDADLEPEKAKAEEAKRQADNIIAQAQQTTAGLRPLLEAAHQALAEHNDKRTTVLDQFLKSEAEQACAAYLEHAKHVIDELLRLVALDILILPYGQRFLAYGWQDSYLPLFNLPPCRGMGANGDKSVLFKLQHSDTAVKKATTQELARIRALGVEL